MVRGARYEFRGHVFRVPRCEFRGSGFRGREIANYEVNFSSEAGTVLTFFCFGQDKKMKKV
jgi:hypothetical protein